MKRKFTYLTAALLCTAMIPAASAAAVPAAQAEPAARAAVIQIRPGAGCGADWEVLLGQLGLGRNCGLGRGRCLQRGSGKDVVGNGLTAFLPVPEGGQQEVPHEDSAQQGQKPAANAQPEEGTAAGRSLIFSTIACHGKSFFPCGIWPSTGIQGKHFAAPEW